MGRGENEDEILKFLWLLKSKLPRDPKLLTVDFSGSWQSPIKRVFPVAKIQRCEFHALQLLNRAISKDLTWFGRERFAAPIKELMYFSRCLRKEMSVKNLRKRKWTSELVLKSLPHYAALLRLKRIKDAAEFEAAFLAFIRTLEDKPDQFDLFFAEELARRYPSSGVAKKNLGSIKKALFQAQRKVLRVFREHLEEEKARFSECRFLLLTRPERLSRPNQELLGEFLSDHPEFQKYRELSLQLGEAFRATSRRQAEERIEALNIWDDTHPDLKAAITTLKTHQAELFAFHEFATSPEELVQMKGIKCVAEYQMRSIKRLYREKFGFRTKKNTQTYLQGALNCETVICF